MEHTNEDRVKIGLLAVAAAGLVLGLVFHLAGQAGVARLLWAVATAPVLIALLVQIVRSLFRGELGLDIVAALSMSAALAFGETLAAVIVALMYTAARFWKAMQRDGRDARCMRCCRVCREPQRGISTGD